MKNKTVIAALLVTLSLLGAPNAQPASNTEAQNETGQLNGATFRIEVPAAWNKGLVMYCHGYEFTGTPPLNWNDTQSKSLRDVFLSRGYAFAQSAYSTKGWAVK